MRATFIFMITFSANVNQFSYFSLLNSERISGKRRNQNCHLPSNLLPHYLAKRKGSTIQLYIYIIKHNMLHVIQHLFHKLLFVYFLLPNTDVIMTLLQYFDCCITHSFQL